MGLVSDVLGVNKTAAPAQPAAAKAVGGWGARAGATAMTGLNAQDVEKMQAAANRLVEQVTTSHADVLRLMPEAHVRDQLRSYISTHANIAEVEGVDKVLGSMNPRDFIGSALKSLRENLPERIGHSVDTPNGRIFVQDMSKEEHNYRHALDQAAKKLGQAVETGRAGWSEMGKWEKAGVGAGGALASLLFLVGIKQTWDAAHAVDPATGQQKVSWNQAMLGALNLAFGAMVGAGVAMQLGKGR